MRVDHTEDSYLDKLLDNFNGITEHCEGNGGHIIEIPVKVGIVEKSPGIDVAAGEKIWNIRVVTVQSSRAEF